MVGGAIGGASCRHVSAAAALAVVGCGRLWSALVGSEHPVREDDGQSPVGVGPQPSEIKIGWGLYLIPHAGRNR